MYAGKARHLARQVEGLMVQLNRPAMASTICSHHAPILLFHSAPQIRGTFAHMSSSKAPPGLRGSSRIISNPLFRDEVEFIRYSQETNGEVCEVRITLGPSGGNPIHFHTSFAETFQPEIGKLGVHLGGKELILSPGETATVPKLTNHRFYNPSDKDTIVFIGKQEPGLESFEKGLHIVYGLARDGLTSKDGIPTSLVHLALFITMTNTRLPGVINRLMNPLFGAIAWYGRWSGEEQRLVKKYWDEY